MKRLAFLTVAGFFAFGVVSCKKEGCIDPTADNYNEEAKKDDGSCTYTNNNNNNTNNNNNSTTTFTCDVDGSGYSADSVATQFQGGQFSIAAANVNGATVSLVFSNLATGTQNLTPYSTFYSPGGSTIYQAWNSSGTVNISSISSDSIVDGTFSFYGSSMAGDTVFVSNGQFTNIDF